MENAKNAQVRSHKKYQKFASLQSWQISKNSQVRGQRKYTNYLGQQLCKNNNNSQVCSHWKLS